MANCHDDDDEDEHEDDDDDEDEDDDDGDDDDITTTVTTMITKTTNKTNMTTVPFCRANTIMFATAVVSTVAGVTDCHGPEPSESRKFSGIQVGFDMPRISTAWR